MNTLREKATQLQKFVKLFERKPEAGLLKPVVKASTKNGLVILKAGNTTWEEDFPPSLGGENTTIGPLQHLLGSLAGCAAGLIKNTLAPLTDTSVDSVDADAQCEFDVKRVLGVEGATGEIRNVSLTVTFTQMTARIRLRSYLRYGSSALRYFSAFRSLFRSPLTS